MVDTQIEYDGQGRAEFLNPPGAVEGRARVQFDDSGTCSIELQIERMMSEYPLERGLMQLFSARNMIGDAGEQPNPCIKLAVTTPQGEFSSIASIHYGYSVKFPDCTAGKITFTLLRSQFDAAVKGHPAYWVIPLTNFLSSFVMTAPTFDRHPLRIYPTPIVPDGLTEMDEFIATHNANLKNRLIIFEFMGKLGFIEALPDYSIHEKNLTEGRERYAISAVMVGEVGSNSIEEEYLKKWFPQDFLRLLSIVTGLPFILADSRSRRRALAINL